MDKKRKFTRVTFHAIARIESEDRETSIEGKIINLSLNGMQITAEHDFKIEDKVHIELLFVGTRPNVPILLEGVVVRIDEKGVGIQFDIDGIRLESLTQLHNAVSYNLGDDDIVMEEYFDYLASE